MSASFAHFVVLLLLPVTFEPCLLAAIYMGQIHHADLATHDSEP